MEQAKIEVIRFNEEDVIATSGTAAPYRHIVTSPAGTLYLVDSDGDGFTQAELMASMSGGLSYASEAAANAAGYYFDVTIANSKIYEYSNTTTDGKWHFKLCTNYSVSAAGLPKTAAGTHFRP